MATNTIPTKKDLETTKVEAIETVRGNNGAPTNDALAARLAALEALFTGPNSLANIVAQHTTDIAARLPLAGGTLTGPLNVMAPTTAANPLQQSSLPLSMTIAQALPLIALGGTYSFPITVANAAVGQVVILNMQQSMLNNLNFYSAVVTAPNTVTVTLKAGVAIAAGTQTFYLRVLR